MLIGRSLETTEMECTVGCPVCASGAVVAGSQNAFQRPASQALRSPNLRDFQVSRLMTADPCLQSPLRMLECAGYQGP